MKKEDVKEEEEMKGRGRREGEEEEGTERVGGPKVKLENGKFELYLILMR